MDDFVDATTDVWDIPAESATRVGHPAPFPIELPQRLIELYTYRGDLVLDPFIGSGYDCRRRGADRTPLHRLRHRAGVRGPRREPDRTRGANACAALELIRRAPPPVAACGAGRIQRSR